VNVQQIEKAMSLLTPETVSHIEGMPFDHKASTIPIPSLIEVLESIDEVEMVGPDVDPDDPQMIDVKAQCRINLDIEERMIVLPRHIIIAGLAQDHDPENPLEARDGEGHIHHRADHWRKDEEAAFYVTLGYTKDGSKDVNNGAVRHELANLIWDEVRKDSVQLGRLETILVRSEYIRTVKEAIHKACSTQTVEDIDDEDQCWQGVVMAFGMTPDQDHNPTALDHIETIAEMMSEMAEKAWDAGDAKGSIGNPLAVTLDIYEHGGRLYSVSETGFQAVWTPCDEAIDNLSYRLFSDLGLKRPEHIKKWNNPGQLAQWLYVLGEKAGLDVDSVHAKIRKEASEYAKGVLENYNQYLSGEVYCVVVYVIDRATGERIKAEDDESWGHFGYSSAKEEIEISMLATALRFTEPASAEAVAH